MCKDNGNVASTTSDVVLPVKLSEALTDRLSAGPLPAGITIEVKFERDREEEDVK